MVYFNPERVEVKRVAGYVLLIVSFLINIPLQVGISIYGLVYTIRAFVDGDILTGMIAISVAAVCVAIARLAVGLMLTPLNDLSASLLSKTDIETTCREQWEWQRKQTEKGNTDKKRSILDADVQHIKDSLGGILVGDLARDGQRRE